MKRSTFLTTVSRAIVMHFSCKSLPPIAQRVVLLTSAPVLASVESEIRKYGGIGLRWAKEKIPAEDIDRSRLFLL